MNTWMDDIHHEHTGSLKRFRSSLQRIPRRHCSSTARFTRHNDGMLALRKRLESKPSTLPGNKIITPILKRGLGTLEEPRVGIELLFVVLLVCYPCEPLGFLAALCPAFAKFLDQACTSACSVQGLGFKFLDQACTSACSGFRV